MNPQEQNDFNDGWDHDECISQDYGDMGTDDALVLDERVEDFERGAYDEQGEAA